MSTRKNDADWGRFLEFVVNSVPRIEAPAFFAARVANTAQIERYSFAGSLQAFSRRLIPLFMTLMVVVCFAVYQWTAPDPLIESAMFYDEEHLTETVSVEYVAGSLALQLDKENEDH